MGVVFIDQKDLRKKDIRFIDARFELGNSETGRQMYDAEHIEGAIYWDLERDLSDMTSDEGRHPMISKEKMTTLVQQAGLTLDDTIVIYDQGASPFALRAYFLLDWAGFTDIHVLREGYSELRNLLPVSEIAPSISATDTIPAWNDSIYVDMAGVRQIISGGQVGQLVDARSNIRFRGESEPLDKIAGHIPTAVNFDWEQLKADGKFLIQDALKEKLQLVSDPTKPVIAYCGSGVTAAPLYASLKEAGYENVKLYVGSYSDWIRENGIETN
ncbi:sulfurtransferase [Psychrobacillus sp.]|uniref:sulfurtransferase n=1 Tax=Psychrobacillus sp. TaxID=1871623 RepID=UPI0028BD5C8D|nr:sulfurtransferase [Psychrobacillus sp.]